MKYRVSGYMQSTLVVTEKYRRSGAWNMEILKEINQPLKLTSG